MTDAIQSLGLLVNSLFLVHDEATRKILLERLTVPKHPTMLGFVNTHAANLSVDDPKFYADLFSADMLLRDGVGMAMLLRQLGIDPGLNLNGSDLIPILIERFRGRRIALFGTSEPWLSRAAAIVRRTGSVVITLDGFKADNEYISEVKSTPADLIILAMGMPKQEHIAAMMRATLEMPCLIVCGGAILDFLSDRVARAPPWIRAAGLEWLFRLCQEPCRLFYRYIVGNVVFLWRAFRLVRSRKR